MNAQNVVVYTGAVTDTQYVKTTGNDFIYDIKKFGDATNNSYINGTDGIQLNGAATQWNDLFFPFSTGTAGGNSYPVFNGDSMTWNFVVDTTGPTKCIQYFQVQLPHGMFFDTICPHVHYKHTTGQGTPTFIFKYKWFNISATTITPWLYKRLNNPSGGTGNFTHGLVDCSSPIIANGKTFSSILVCWVYLLTTSGVTKTCDAWQMDIHYKIKSFGTKYESRD
jgi:hypothetical protein